MPLLAGLLKPARGEAIIDIGCGAGAFALAVTACGATYVGVDLSKKLIALAKKHHRSSRFFVGDATRLSSVTSLRPKSFDGATFLLSLQDINPLEDAIASAAWALKPHGKLAIVLIHPCFRVPRQSGWGWDDGRKLRFRRVDRYLRPLDVPMQEYSGEERGVTRSYHRSLQDYFEALSNAEFIIERLREMPGPLPPQAAQEKRAYRLAREEIPLFLGLRARLPAG